jgi:hypothetical protein
MGVGKNGPIGIRTSSNEPIVNKGAANYCGRELKCFLYVFNLTAWYGKSNSSTEAYLAQNPVEVLI